MNSRFTKLALMAALLQVVAQAQTPLITGVVNSASKVSKISPGTLVDVIGTNLPTVATATATVAGNRNALVVSRNSNKWVIQIPFGLATGPTTIEVGGSAPFITSLSAFSPAIFSADATGGGVVSAQVRHSQTSSYALSAGNPARLGDLLVVDSTGLGPIDENEGNVTLETPVVTIGGVPMLVASAFLATAPATAPGSSATKCISSSCTAGMYQVLVSLPPAMLINDQNSFILTTGGETTQAQTLSVPIGKAPLLNSVVNAASFNQSSPIVPGSLATAFGTTFGVKDQPAGFPATTFQGVSVSFNGTKAPLLFLGTDVRDAYGQINLQAPVELPEAGPVAVKVTTADGDSQDLTIQMAAAAPGIFYFFSQANQQRHNAVAFVENTSWVAVPNDLAQEAGIAGNCRAGSVSTSTLCGEPAKRLDTLLIYATGMGKAYPDGDITKSPLGTGQATPASPAYRPATTPNVTIGNVPATVSSVALVPGSTVPVFVIRVQIPSNAPVGDDIPVTVTASNSLKDDSTTIAVQQ